jgi:hypothetical protein
LAGNLIDIIKTKGASGFVAFMEVIEYEYPELYTTMTSLEARLPPKSLYILFDVIAYCQPANMLPGCSSLKMADLHTHRINWAYTNEV